MNFIPIIIFAVFAAIQCGYYLYFLKFSLYKPPLKERTNERNISLIICAKNEAENLQTNIPLWLSQNYSSYELILINDSSSDDTLKIMEQFQCKDNRIKIVNVKGNDTFWGSKKYALTLGIKKAKCKHMVFTDADCAPASNQWLSHMARGFSDEKQLILGYGAYAKQKGLLNALVRFETALTATQYLAYALHENAYMGVGRNLGYTGTLYYQHNGFTSHIKVASGDDDLFVNQVSDKVNTNICVHQEAFTYSQGKDSWKSYWFQKKRHVSTAKFYKSKHKIQLGLFYLSTLLFWLVCGFIFFITDWKIPMTIISIKLLFQYIAYGKSFSLLKEKGLIPFIPFLELCLVCFQICIFISNSISKSTRWK